MAFTECEEDLGRKIAIFKNPKGIMINNKMVKSMVNINEDIFLESKLTSQYIKKLKILDKERGISFKSIRELRKIIEGY